MRGVFRTDTSPVTDYLGVRQGIVDPEVLAEDAVNLFQSSENSDGLDKEVVGAFNGFLTGPEKHRYNGVSPSENSADRQKFLNSWKGYTLSSDNGPTLDNNSELSDQLENLEDSGPVVEDVQLLGEWVADTYQDRGPHRSVSGYMTDDIMQVETGLGVIDEDQEALRVLKPGGVGERALLDSALRLTGTEGERVQVLGLNDGLEVRNLEREVAEELVDGGIEEALEESSDFYSEVIEETASDIMEETGIEFEDVPDREFLNLMSISDPVVDIDTGEAVSDALEEASKEYSDYHEIQEGAAEKVGEVTGIVYPHMMEPETYLSAVSGADLSDLDVMDLLESNALSRAKDISNTTNLSGEAFEALRDLEEGEVYRDTDENGKRVYRWNEGSAYSVTTIIDPLPTSHRELDTGGGLFFWKNIYDGSDGRYDSEVIRDYAGDRGTLAHEEVFSNYVDDESEVRGDTDSFWNSLETLGSGEDGLGELENVVDWKGGDETSILEYAENEEGFVQNGRDLAEKEIEWIEDQFQGLEEALGLNEENVIYAEQEFAVSTRHPWDESEDIEGPGIGEISYGGTADLIYEHEDTGEIVLLDLKTGSLKPDYTVQQAAYKHAVEESDFFDDPRLEDGVDRVVIPEIDPEEMMYSDKDPVLHTDRPHHRQEYTTSEFLDASDVDLESTGYRKNRWRPENWHEEALYLFARATEQMPDKP